MTATASIGTRDGLAQMLGVLDRLEVDRSRLGAADRLECVRLARKLTDRATVLASVLVAEADATGAAEQAAGTAMVSWLAVDAGASKREAAGTLRQGRLLVAHPVVAEAAAAGGIGVGQARSITRVLDSLAPQLDEDQQQAAEQLMVGMARHLDADGLVQAAPRVLSEVAPATAEGLLEHRLQREAEQAHRERSLRFHEVGGSIRFDGSLPKPVGRAWVGLLDTYLHATRRTILEERDRLAEPLTWEQRRADALALLIQQHQHHAASAMARSAEPRRTAPERGERAGWNRPAAEPGHPRGGLPTADRARIFVVVDYDKFAAEAAGAGLLNGVDPLSAGDLRRLCCDAGILPVVMGGDSVILDLGQERRLVNPELRAALELRDRGCVMPGCDTGTVGCEAHHIVPWAWGGATALHNLALLCVQHHPRFEPTKNGIRQPWRLRIGTDGIPEVIPPSFAQLADVPIRHQRFTTPPARAG
ncbi:MAG: HNH endonuclease [Actinobacteria bacterium]|nr:HNH endonuclease [Actinomycetota bacterium]